MGTPPEFLMTNRVDLATTLDASSEKVSLPVENILDTSRKKVWQSTDGYTIALGFNDLIHFDNGGGALIATLTPGEYATPALLATEATTQMNAAGGGVDHTVSHGTPIGKFRIAKAAGTLNLNFTSTNRPAHPDLGFADVNKTGLLSYDGDGRSYCGREWIGFQAPIGSATRAVIINHNFSASAVVRLMKNGIFDRIGATEIATFTIADEIILEFNQQIQQNWFIDILDTQNTDTHVEMGRVFLGRPDITSRYLQKDITFAVVDDSIQTRSPEGVIGKNEKEKFHRVAFDYRRMVSADRDLLLGFYRQHGHSSHFFLRVDPGKLYFDEDKLNLMYGYFMNQEQRFQLDAGHSENRWQAGIVFEEAR